jgi:hypothetical protein
MAFFTRRGASSVPEIPTNSPSHHGTSGNDREISEEDAKKYSFLLDRDGVEV